MLGTYSLGKSETIFVKSEKIDLRGASSASVIAVGSNSNKAVGYLPMAIFGSGTADLKD